MKRFIKSSERDVIFSSEYFDFIRTEGIGMNDTPWSGLAVISKGLAKKHVVEIRLNTIGGFPRFDGEPVVYKYRDCEIAHGMRSVKDTLEDTEEYIDVLEAALDFARDINDWLTVNQ